MYRAQVRGLVAVSAKKRSAGIAPAERHNTTKIKKILLYNYINCISFPRKVLYQFSLNPKNLRSIPNAFP